MLEDDKAAFVLKYLPEDFPHDNTECFTPEGSDTFFTRRQLAGLVSVVNPAGSTINVLERIVADFEVKAKAYHFPTRKFPNHLIRLTDYKGFV